MCPVLRLPLPGRNKPAKPAIGDVRYNQSVITVLLFASVAEKAGTRRLELPAAEGETVAHLRDRLVARFPQLEPMLPNLLFALDEEYVKPEAFVTAGSTLAVIPPVSGGC